MSQQLIIKYNSSALAILCPKCRTIIKTGAHFTKEEMSAAKGEIVMEAYLCDKCKEPTEAE